MHTRSLALAIVLLAAALPTGSALTTAERSVEQDRNLVVERDALDEDNQPPLANAGLDRRVPVRETVFLDGGGSVDPDGQIVAVEWRVETPEDELVEPRDTSALTTRFTPNTTGQYEITLRVTDDDGETRTDTVFLTVYKPTDSGSDETAEGGNGSELATDDTQPADKKGEASSTGGNSTAKSGNAPPYGQVDGPDSVTRGTPATFLVEAGDMDGTVKSYRWSFGGSDRRVSHVFDAPPGTPVTFMVTLTDDDGKSKAVEKTIVVEAANGTAGTNSLPRVQLSGDDIVRVGESVTYTLRARDPDGTIRRYAWIAPEESTGSTLTRGFSTPGNYTLRASATDDDGGTGWATKQITVLPARTETDEPPVVSITGPDTAGNNSIQQYEVEATDPDGGAVTVQWSHDSGDSQQLDTRGSGVTDGNSVTTVPLTGDVGSVFVVTATVTDDEGNEVTVEKRTRLTAVTEERPDTDARPTVGSFGLQYAPDQEVQTSDLDVIRGKYELSVEVYHSGGEDVTVTWTVGDGTTKTQTFESLDGSRTATISHTFLSENGGTQTYDIAVAVTDQSGNSQEFTTTQTVTTLATTDAVQFSASAGGKTAGEGGTVSVEPGDPVTFDVWSYQSFEVDLGDGTTYTGSGSTRTMSFTHRYENPGRYVTLATSIQGSSGVGSARVVVDVNRESYTEYQYRELVERTEKTVASSRPDGEGWEKGNVDRTEDESTGETRSIKSGAHHQPPSSSDPSVTWVRQRTYQEDQSYLATRVSSDNPGRGWWIEERRWSTKTVTDTSTETQWRESKLSYSGDWSLIGTRTETSTKYTESTDDPGSGWSRHRDTGETKRTGYEYTWYDSKGGHGNAKYTGQKHCVRSVRFFGQTKCVDYDYRYKRPIYESVYEWKKTTTDTDYKYQKEVQTTSTVWQHKWGTKKTRSVTYVEYEKHESVTYWTWTRQRDVGGEWVWRLTTPESGEYVQGTLEQFERRCDSAEGHFDDQKCN
jgi:hypothetical protein